MFYLQRKELIENVTSWRKKNQNVELNERILYTKSIQTINWILQRKVCSHFFPSFHLSIYFIHLCPMNWSFFVDSNIAKLWAWLKWNYMYKWWLYVIKFFFDWFRSFFLCFFLFLVCAWMAKFHMYWILFIERHQAHFNIYRSGGVGFFRLSFMCFCLFVCLFVLYLLWE